jgi:uncharacterized membrane protein YuzA (DUF378 family)
LIGVFQFDLVAAIFGGQAGVISRIIYVIIGLSGIWAISFWGKVARDVHRDTYPSRKESLNYEFGKDYSKTDNQSKGRFDNSRNSNDNRNKDDR